ncbi:protein translocase subunit SecDF [Spiroplasma platyhelix]|uniref:Protein translocase n=1 Tax=Spiroplasma platyhelix PALS-1 TaxID=1276218 RepID=A0A846U042_9MOLU|nr:protein translocase [Spiroplasma platyhelix]MBE4704023.1 hypothetical protein [Spiroplasma platyhelix PALS-1]NKE38394.1 protein translocase [Spiroplasma platyhelix PALS-1]UJB29281.1 bifunctional preprotein translocase subunit SecD/SecF [Spiroplasma platyhelix PALS-1]
MKKSSSTIKNKKKAKNLSFFTRVTTLFILAATIIISAVFSINYLDSNSNLSIEFAGGYQAQVKYEGVYEENSKTHNVVDLLENRVDPLGTSNINIEKSTRTGNYYNVSISKSAGVDWSIFVNNIARRGYVYLLDEQGHDLLANNFSDDKNWTAKEERLTTNEAFSSIYHSTNFNSGQPEVIFDTSSELITTIQKIMQETNEAIYFYSDIGGLLNYIRNTWTGLQELIDVIDKETDSAKQLGLKALLANNTAGLDDDSGKKMYAAVKSSNRELINLLNQSRNGVYMINWKYNDNVDSIFPLSVDTNDKASVFDPANPFDPTKDKSSPMNAWLPHIKDLIILPEISNVLETSIINYKYAPYYIGTAGISSNTQITINDETFNKEKVQQIVNVLNAGLQKNNFTVEAILNIDPTLGAQSLKVAMIGLLVALIFLAIAMIFNYRLLGLSAVFIIILFLVATLVAFSFLNNVVAPETGIALIIGFALLLDTIVGLFNAIQKEYKTGKTVFDAFKSANKKSLVSAFDCSVIVLIVSLTIFWFGSRSIRGFAIMTSISTFGVMLLGILFLRLIIYLMLKNNTFESKPELLSLTQDKTRSSVQVQMADLEVMPEQNLVAQKKTSKTKKIKVKLAVIKQTFVQKIKLDKKPNFWHISQWNFWYKTTKWIMAGFGVILLSSGVVYLATGSNFGAGFDSRIDFTGETAAEGTPSDPNFNLWQQADKKKSEVVQALEDANKSYEKVYASLILDSLGASKNVIRIIVQTNVKDSAALEFREFLEFQVPSLSWFSSNINGLSGNQLFKDMLIVIAISLITIFLYVIVRFQMTFTIPLIAAIVFAVSLTLALLALLQITISTMTIGVILALVILVLINSVVIFDNIKEIKLNNHEKRDKLEKAEIIAISNDGVKKSLSRTLAVNSIIIVTALVVLCFLPSFWSVSLALILGTIVTFLATHFVAPWLWTFFEKRRIKRYQKRAEKIKKHFVGPDEYIIEGIND